MDKIVKSLMAMEKNTGASFAGLKNDTEEYIHLYQAALFPSIIACGCISEDPARRCEYAYQKSIDVLRSALSYVIDTGERINEIVDTISEKLPEIKEIIMTDVQAAYEGDPAAKDTNEVMLTYPAFTAISIHRIAHVFYTLGVPLIPRIMTEYAHRVTGIDIHPGATIGRSFFIDHGTGVVIGETTTIGEHVKLYQHVTLGAKSFQAAEDGTLVKGIKRHPDIGDNVVIYAGATILGGNTRIGNNCVIGGNVWLTHSVKDGETVLAKAAKEKKPTDPEYII